MSNLNFILVGCGNIGRRHASLICKRNKLLAVCDILPERAAEFGTHFSCSNYTDIRSMIRGEHADVLVVCSPNGFHAEHAVLALENAMHVLCEKPMAIKIEDCRKMISTAEKNNKHLMVVKQNRYNPPVRKVKELLNSGALGRISSFQVNGFWNRPAGYYHNSWHGSLNMDGGTLFTQFSHFIDLLYWFLGDVENVEGMAGNFQHAGMMEFEDCGSVVIKMNSGAVGSFNYTVNAFEKNMEGSLTLFGEHGTVKIGGPYLNKLEYWNVDGIAVPELDLGNQANDYGAHSGSMNNHSLVYDHLETVLKGKDKPLPEAYDAMKTVEIISTIYKKIR